MYKITKQGEVIACLDSLTYIKKAANGCYVLSDQEDAQGIVVHGTPYTLLGRTPMDGLEEVMAVESHAVASPDDDRSLGREITAMELEGLAQCQRQTALELDLLEQGQYITDMELEGLNHV